MNYMQNKEWEDKIQGILLSMIRTTMSIYKAHGNGHWDTWLALPNCLGGWAEKFDGWLGYPLWLLG